MRRLLIILIALCVAVPSYADDFMYFKKKAAGGGGSTTYANDNFTGTDNTLLSAHTSDSGHTWTKSGGGSNIQIKSNAADPAAENQFGIYYISATSASADYSVQASVSVVDYGDTSIGPAGRISTSATTGYWVGWGQTYGRWDLFRFADEYTVVSIGNWPVSLDAGGDPHAAPVVVKLTMTGTTISVLFNGTQRISVTDNTYQSAGRAGIGIYYTATTSIGDTWSAINP